VHGESGLDGPALPDPTTQPVDAHAVDLLAQLLEPGVVLVPTGPLTNIALLLERHPDVRDRLERIVWLGGAIAEGNATPAAEFNAYVDPEAAATVFAGGIPLTMIGLDVTHKALFTDEHAARLRDTGKVGRVVAELADFFHQFHERRYGMNGSPIHDAVAVAHVLDPTLVTTLRTNVAAIPRVAPPAAGLARLIVARFPGDVGRRLYATEIACSGQPSAARWAWSTRSGVVSSETLTTDCPVSSSRSKTSGATRTQTAWPWHRSRSTDAFMPQFSPALLRAGGAFRTRSPPSIAPPSPSRGSCSRAAVPAPRRA
jgi:hypothetical protein